MKTVKDKKSIPQRRSVSKAKNSAAQIVARHKMGRFLDEALIRSTTSALEQRIMETECLNSVCESLLRSRKLFGQSPDWLRRFDFTCLAAHLLASQGRIDSESELLKMLAPDGGGN